MSYSLDLMRFSAHYFKFACVCSSFLMSPPGNSQTEKIFVARSLEDVVA